MCGIVATYGADPDIGVVQLTKLLTRHLSHRGPDGIGAGSSGKSVVAHARLSIVDIARGQQPMHAEDGQTLLACNGEIYNHRHVRHALGQAHQFRSASDSEVVLHLFEDMGPELLQRLDGMFAFFVTDGVRFLAARDALGIKPLYVGEDELGGLWFASELKALVGHCPTLMAVPPGAFVTESRRVERWFTPSWSKSVGTRADVTADEILSRLEQAVVKRLMSDVPIGVLLSGGLDSSVVAALARRHLPRLKTFAVGVEGAPDLAAARLVSDALRTEHHEYVYSVREVSRCLHEVIYHLESYDAALVRSAIPCYFVSCMAADHVKVALTGEGADELFSGYAHMQRIRDPDALHRESARLLMGLHSMNLQRVDRMTMAHGLEGRVPFLDVEFVDFVMGLDPRLKLRQPGSLEKALLRSAAEQVLPREIAQRPKLEFSQGSATDVVLEQYAAARVTDHDMAYAADEFPLDTPRNKEELLYRSIFEELFPGEPARRTVSRWVVPSPQPMLS
jgi:asparagine synthase (glutamine-hydrolysing)